MSVLATTLRSGAATTAASSPGPSRTAGVVVSRDVSSLMSPNSPNSPTVPFTESHLSFIAPDTRPGPRSRAVCAVGTVKRYVNFCALYATLWTSSGP